jgi:hypothetical protein
VRLGPTLSPSHPPKTCSSAYGSANAESAIPSSVLDSPSDPWMYGAAVEMLTRSMYDNA